MNVDGQTAIITGGASGLGEGTARELAEAGAKVAIWDIQEDKGMAVTVEHQHELYTLLVDRVGDVIGIGKESFCQNTLCGFPQRAGKALRKASAASPSSRIRKGRRGGQVFHIHRRNPGRHPAIRRLRIAQLTLLPPLPVPLHGSG